MHPNGELINFNDGDGEYGANHWTRVLGRDAGMSMERICRFLGGTKVDAADNYQVKDAYRRGAPRLEFHGFDMNSYFHPNDKAPFEGMSRNGETLWLARNRPGVSSPWQSGTSKGYEPLACKCPPPPSPPSPPNMPPPSPPSPPSTPPPQAFLTSNPLQPVHLFDSQDYVRGRFSNRVVCGSHSDPL